MGCAASRVSKEQQLAQNLYNLFGEGKIQEIVDAGTDDQFYDWRTQGETTYSGLHKGRDDVLAAFQRIGKAWGPQVAEFSQADWKKTGEGKIELNVTIRVLVPGGGMLSGTEKHSWEFDMASGKCKSLTLGEAKFHEAAFAERSQDDKNLEVAKFAVELFQTGRSELMVQKVWAEDGAMTCGTEEDKKVVPYAGTYKGKEGDASLFKGFQDLGKAWGMDVSFVPDEKSWKSENGKVDVNFNVKVNLPSGKTLANECEAHVGEFGLVKVKGPDGSEVDVTACKAWTVADIKAHVAAFSA